MTTSGVESKGPRGLRITLRDLQILETLAMARYMSTPQIQKLFWSESQSSHWGPIKACQQRMRLLRTHGLVRAIVQPIRLGQGAQPLIYTLDRKGAVLLTSEVGIPPEELDWKPKPQEENYPFLEHLLATTDFRITMEQGCSQTGVELEEWMDEKELKSSQNIDYVELVGPQGGRVKAAVVPDAYFMLRREERRGIFFVEVDLKTVTIAPTKWERRGWLRRIRAYVEYFRSEAYLTKYNGRRARVLTVTFGRTRLQHLKAATERVFDEYRKAGLSTSDQDRFWFALLDEGTAPVVWLTEPVWLVAGSDAPRSLVG